MFNHLFTSGQLLSHNLTSFWFFCTLSLLRVFRIHDVIISCFIECCFTLWADSKLLFSRHLHAVVEWLFLPFSPSAVLSVIILHFFLPSLSWEENSAFSACCFFVWKKKTTQGLRIKHTHHLHSTQTAINVHKTSPIGQLDVLLWSDSLRRAEGGVPKGGSGYKREHLLCDRGIREFLLIKTSHKNKSAEELEDKLLCWK